MSIYIFENPHTGEIKEVAQKMSDEHVHVDESGLEGLLWKSSIISIATKAWDENWSKYY